MPYYAICSEPGLNYEGKVFTTVAQLLAYKRGKTPTRGRFPWYARFEDRAEAYRFAEIPMPDERLISLPKRKREDENVPSISGSRPALKRPRLGANNNQRSNLLQPRSQNSVLAPSASTSPSNDIDPCPSCFGKCLSRTAWTYSI